MNLEPDVPSAAAPNPKARRRYTMSVGRMMKVVLGLACFFALVTFMSRAVWHASEAARLAECTGHLKQIAMALHNYHQVYGVFPPAYIADEHGKPMHSWRVLILPYMGSDTLYAQYDFSEPWDGPNNITLLGQMPNSFDCPSRLRGRALSTSTNYAVVSGQGTMFPGAKSIRLDEVVDGADNTLMVVEVSNAQIPWTKPEDLDLGTMSLGINDEKRPSISSPHRHRKGVNVAFSDGSCWFLPESTTADRLRSMLTIAGGEPVTKD
jgi:prepilin-type processing-associated H-X9-DG protein